MEEKAILKEWVIGYLKHKDIIARKIKDIKDNGDKLFVEDKSGDYEVLLLPDLNKVVKKIDDNKKTLIVTFNTESNLKALITAWHNLKENSQLTIYFTNPLSELDKRWIIRPKSHSLICDEESLEQGLKSMFEMVEPVTAETIKLLIKSVS